MPQPSIVLFDLGSTLIYSDGSWPEVIKKAMRAVYDQLVIKGLSLDRDKFIETFHQRLNDYYIERDTEFIEYTTSYILSTLLETWGYSDLPVDMIQQAVDSLYAVTQQHWRTETETHNTLQTLREQGYRLAIISNAGDDNDVQSLVNNANIRPYFEIILSSANLGIRKPNPRIFEIALEKLHAAPNQAVMVGDTLGADILGAQNAGIFDIWITRRADTPANRAHADTITPSAQIESLAELPGLLARLGKDLP